MKKLLIIGGGFVGGHVAQKALDQWQVHIIDIQLKNGLSDEIKWHLLDILDSDKIAQTIKMIGPDAIVITAAISDIDYAESNQEIAFNINVKAAENIALAAQLVKAQLVYLSSDAVYNGAKDWIDETQSLNPVNFYGKTKMQGEAAVLKVHPNALILRLSLVLGLSYTLGNSFVEKLQNQLENKLPVLTTDKEVRTPIDVRTLADVILQLIKQNKTGIFHVGCRDAVNRFELTKFLATALGFSADRIEKRLNEKLPPNRAPRHKYGMLSIKKIENALNIKMLTISETIQQAIEKLKRGNN